MSAEYLKPKLNASFDKIAGEVMRGCMEDYERAPDVVKSLLENIAVLQGVHMMGLERHLTEKPINGNT